MNGIGAVFASLLHEAFDRTATPENVDKALRILRGTLEPESVAETAAWERQCHHRQSLKDRQLDACDTLLGTGGVEYIGEVDTRFGPPLLYLNTGDSYAATVLWYRDRVQPYAVGCWADVVERFEVKS